MKILITAGPTREAIDPVRYISNRSSGKMGFALAAAAVDRGHEVILVNGPVSLTVPPVAECVPVQSAEEMYEAVSERIEDVDAAIFCAAVSDYRVTKVEDQKIKKMGNGLTLELEETKDILGSARKIFGFNGILIGFAAETENLETNAREKLERKGCDILVANDVSRQDIGFDRENNEVRLFFKDGRSSMEIALQSKRAIGERIIELIEKEK